MKEEEKQMVSLKIEELVTSLKINMEDEHWEMEVSKSLCHIITTYRIYLGIGIFFLLGFAVLGFMTVFVDVSQQLPLGIDVNSSYLYMFILIAFISNIFYLAGKVEVKKERLITLLFLHNLNK